MYLSNKTESTAIVKNGRGDRRVVDIHQAVLLIVRDCYVRVERTCVFIVDVETREVIATRNSYENATRNSYESVIRDSSRHYC